MNSIEIHTKRLVLRPLSLKYLETVYEYASDIENAKYMVHLPSENIKETSDFLHRVEDEWSKKDPEFFEFAIIYENSHIGAVSVYVDELPSELLTEIMYASQKIVKALKLTYKSTGYSIMQNGYSDRLTTSRMG